MAKLYYGWYVVALAMVVYALIVGSTFGAFGVFVLPVSADLGLTRAEMNTALIFMSVGMAGLAPFIGRLLDRFSLKLMMIIGGVLFTLAYVGLGLSKSAPASSAMLLVLVPAAYLGGSSITLTVLLARWFTVQRGRAMLLAGIGMSLGNVIVTPAIGYLVESYGWRPALMITGAVVGTIVALAGLIVRDRPGPNDVETRAAPHPEQSAPAQSSIGQPHSVRAILAMPQFWLLTVSGALAFGVFQTLGATVIPLALEHGNTMSEATRLMSIMGVCAIIGCLLLSVVADKVDRIAALAGFFVLGAIMNALLLTGASYPLLVLCAAIMGVAGGGMSPVFYALLADRFGLASFGTVRGLSLLVISVAGMIAVRFGGEVFDRTKSYQAMFVTFTIVTLAAAAGMLATRFIRAPALEPAPVTPS